MGLDIYKVHEYSHQEGPNGKVAVLVKSRPYVRMVSASILDREGIVIEERTPMICQDGSYYSDGGDKMKKEDVPDWFWQSAAKMSEEGRKKCKLVLPSAYKKASGDKPSTVA